jgi:hypothetical protein
MHKDKIMNRSGNRMGHEDEDKIEKKKKSKGQRGTTLHFQE